MSMINNSCSNTDKNLFTNSEKSSNIINNNKKDVIHKEIKYRNKPDNLYDNQIEEKSYKTDSEIKVKPNSIHIIDNKNQSINNNSYNNKMYKTNSQIHNNNNKYMNNICNKQSKSLRNNNEKKKDNIVYNKYRQYDISNLQLKAVKNMSKIKPHNLDFLERVEFYSEKKKNKDIYIDLFVNKHKKRIHEKDKIDTFNRLIEDANRRAEAKRRVNFVIETPEIAGEILENQNNINITIKPRKKFNQNEFNEKYAKSIKQYKDNKLKNEYKLKEKQMLEKQKEDEIVESMNKRKKRASMDKIIKSSNRLYNKGLLNLNKKSSTIIPKFEDIITNNKKQVKKKSSKSIKVLNYNNNDVIKLINKLNINKEENFIFYLHKLSLSLIIE